MLKKGLLPLLLLMATTMQAQNYKTAAGLRLSSNAAIVNNSVSLKYFVNKVVALEGLVSVKPSAVGILAEVHQPLSSTQGLRFLFGAGAYTSFKRGFGAGAQGILGLDYKFVNAPVNVTADWKPELNFTHTFLFEPAVIGLTARFTFN